MLLLLDVAVAVAAASLPVAFLQGIGQRAVADSPEKYMAMGFLCFVLFSRAPRKNTLVRKREAGGGKEQAKVRFLYVGEIFMPQHEDISFSLSLSHAPSLSVFPCVCAPVVLGGFRIPSAAHPLLATHLVPPISASPPQTHLHMCALDLLSILFVIIVVIVVAGAAALLLFTLTQFGIVLKINGTLVALAWPGHRTVNGTESENCTRIPSRSQIYKKFKLQNCVLAKPLFEPFQRVSL